MEFVLFPTTCRYNDILHKFIWPFFLIRGPPTGPLIYKWYQRNCIRCIRYSRAHRKVKGTWVVSIRRFYFLFFFWSHLLLDYWGNHFGFFSFLFFPFFFHAKKQKGKEKRNWESGTSTRGWWSATLHLLHIETSHTHFIHYKGSEDGVSGVGMIYFIQFRTWFSFSRLFWWFWWNNDELIWTQFNIKLVPR